MGEFDGGSAWLVQHFGRALLGLAGVTLSGGVTALAPKIGVATRVPDGLLQADATDPAAVPELYLLEIATRGETRLPQQMHDDLALSRLALKRVPNGVAFVLWPHAAAGLVERHREESSRGWSSVETRWKVIRCYELDAAAVLVRGEPGLAPIALVAQTTEPAPRLAEQVRQLVDVQVPDGVEQANLLAVCQVFAELRYKVAAALTSSSRPASVPRRDSSLRAVGAALARLPPR